MPIRNDRKELKKLRGDLKDQVRRKRVGQGHLRVMSRLVKEQTQQLVKIKTTSEPLGLWFAAVERDWKAFPKKLEDDTVLLSRDGAHLTVGQLREMFAAIGRK